MYFLNHLCVCVSGGPPDHLCLDHLVIYKLWRLSEGSVYDVFALYPEAIIQGGYYKDHGY